MGGKPDGKHHATKKSAPSRKAAERQRRNAEKIAAAFAEEQRSFWALFLRRKGY